MSLMLTKYYSHRKFIKQPLLELLHMVVSSASSVGNGIEVSAINDYVIHSLFLQMTGAQEQKLKCVVWDLANRDLQYRYDRYTKWDLGECSAIKEKNSVYADIINHILPLKPAYKIFADVVQKKQFLENILDKVDNVLSSSNLLHTHPHQYVEFNEVWNNLKGSNIDGGGQLIITAKNNTQNENLADNEQIFGIYRLLYLHRNRCAHNVMSYQDNLPPLWELRNSYLQKHYNIFLFISVLVMIDEMIMKAYSEYERLEMHVM